MVKDFPKLKSKIVLAPMADITNIAFRLLCKKYGAGLVETEMLSANAIARKNKAVMKLAITDKKEKPVALQLFSQNTENIVKSARFLEKDFDIIDINFGCPSKKIMAQGSGGCLLKRKNKIKEIVEQVSKSIDKPLIIKIRSGYDKTISSNSNESEAVKIAKICEPFISAITIHARTVEQGYSGKADWNVIKQVKQAVKILVIGNGDVIDGQGAEKMLRETNCDYVMMGRAAIGNPFIFKQINEFLKTEKLINQSKEDKIKDYFEYIKLTRKYNIFSVSDAKKRAQEFTRGIKGSKKLRQKLNQVKFFDEIPILMKKLVKLK